MWFYYYGIYEKNGNTETMCLYKGPSICQAVETAIRVRERAERNGYAYSDVLNMGRQID